MVPTNRLRLWRFQSFGEPCLQLSDSSHLVFYFAFVIVFFLFCSAPVFAGPIYVFKQEDGTIRFSSKPPKDGAQAKVFKPHQKNYTYYRSRKTRSKLFHSKYLSIIQTVSRYYGLDPHLVQAVIHVESAFNPRAVSPKGALGLMQIMPFNLKKLGVKKPFVPEQNIRGGSKLLALLTKKYAGNLKLALAAYNAGEGAVEKYRGIPPYTETQNYVRKVLKYRRLYSL